jgi:hypothetical protein
MKCSYTIELRAAELGGGWRLRLIEDGQEVGGGVFLPEDGHDTEVAALQAAFDDAEATAYDWLDSREGPRTMPANNRKLVNDLRTSLDAVATQAALERGDITQSRRGRSSRTRSTWSRTARGHDR